VLNLSSISATQGVLPVTHGTLELCEICPDHITSLAAYRGQADALSAALKSAHGLTLPAINRATGRDGARVIWFGPSVVLVGPGPDASLAQHAAVVDLSDGWCQLRLLGDRIDDVLARLAPVDLRWSVFGRGHVARSQLVHANVAYHRVSETTVDIYGFRSMAHSLVHEITRAMASVDAMGMQ